MLYDTQTVQQEVITLINQKSMLQEQQVNPSVFWQIGKSQISLGLSESQYFWRTSPAASLVSYFIAM